MDQKCRSNAERDDIGKRIEFPSEGTFAPAHASDPSVEQIEDAGQEDEQQSVTYFGITFGQVGFNDVGERHKATEEISCRHEVGQEIDFDPRVGLRRRRLLLNFPDHSRLRKQRIIFCAIIAIAPRHAQQTSHRKQDRIKLNGWPWTVIVFNHSGIRDSDADRSSTGREVCV